MYAISYIIFEATEKLFCTIFELHKFGHYRVFVIDVVSKQTIVQHSPRRE